MAGVAKEAGSNGGQEMKDLIQLLNGRWDMSVTYHASEMMPQGGTFKGQEVNRPGPGGFSLIVDSISDGPAGAFEGLGIIHWSDEGRAYKLYWFTNTGAPPATFTGKWDGRDLIFDGIETMAGTKLASRHSIRNAEANSFDYFIEMGPTAAELKRFITIQYIRSRS